MGHSQLTLEKREIIERLLGLGTSIRKIAMILGYTPSAISQEIARNSAYFESKLVYNHKLAQGKMSYRRRRSRGRTCIPQEVVSYVAEKLEQYWSPDQIQGRLVLDYPSHSRFRVSFKTIYRWIEQARKGRSPLGKKKLFTQFLRLKRQGKRMRPHGPETRGNRNDLPSIDSRPESVRLKNEFGHWEGDLVRAYQGRGYFVTLVEKSTGVLVARYCKDRKPDTVTNSICESFFKFDREHIKTLTLDRGAEFRSFEEIENRLGCSVYFCHPQSPNERALNEQTNGLLRQFYPKRKHTDFADEERLNWAVSLINTRPRKKFAYRTTREIIELRGLAKVLSLV